MPQKLKFSVDPETKEVKQETKIKEDGKVVGSGRFAGSWAELAAIIFQKIWSQLPDYGQLKGEIDDSMEREKIKVRKKKNEDFEQHAKSEWQKLREECGGQIPDHQAKQLESRIEKEREELIEELNNIQISYKKRDEIVNKHVKPIMEQGVDNTVTAGAVAGAMVRQGVMCCGCLDSKSQCALGAAVTGVVGFACMGFGYTPLGLGLFACSAVLLYVATNE